MADMMPTVYLLYEHDYEQSGWLGIYSTPALAQAAAAKWLAISGHEAKSLSIYEVVVDRDVTDIGPSTEVPLVAEAQTADRKT